MGDAGRPFILAPCPTLPSVKPSTQVAVSCLMAPPAAPFERGIALSRCFDESNLKNPDS